MGPAEAFCPKSKNKQVFFDEAHTLMGRDDGWTFLCTRGWDAAEKGGLPVGIWTRRPYSPKHPEYERI